MAGELVKVPFYGDELDAVQDGEKVWVSLRRCCENLGLDDDGQRRKLRGKAWACANEMLAHDSSGREQTITMIDLETLPGWLFSIEARKVSEHVREKLARYQREAAKVLANHFLRRNTPTVDVSKLLGQLEHMQQQIDRLHERALVAPITTLAPVVSKWTVRSRLEHLGYMMSKDARRKVHRIAVGRVESHSEEPLCQAGGVGGGGPTYWTPGNVEHLDEAIRIVREKIEAKRRADEAKRPSLFNPCAA